MPYYFCILFGIAPSFIWLAFYLRKDSHPESNPMILKVFFYGMLSAIPAVFLELGVLDQLKDLNLNPYLVLLLTIFLVVALIEELLKYLVVKFKVFCSQELDEPMDVMLYMIIAALGFAASENLLVFLSFLPNFILEKALTISIFRLLGATFLHTLSSGILGYFLAMSIYKTKKRVPIFLLGFALAVMFHGFYNLPMMQMNEFITNPFNLSDSARIGIPTIILVFMAVFVTAGFNKLKKMKGSCKVF